ncbi:MAG: TetR/AcrR family transcriptional regulator [Anaerocolumna sp.]
MSDKNKGNPKSNQSKLWMEDALLKLMHRENYQEITIQEITDHAGLSRRTFYRNYFSKDQILEDCFYKIWLEYRTLLLQQTNLSLSDIARVFFTLMHKHKDFLLLVNRHQLLPLFLAKVDELLPPAFYEVRGENTPFTKESIKYALTFSTGGFLRILILWLNDRVQKSPEEMAGILKDFISICNYPSSSET